MTKLSVNLNKIALLRNSRGRDFPNVVTFAAKFITLGVHGITEAWSTEHGDVRKCLFHKFPFKMLYSIENDHIFVIAVAHQHRKPEYWIDREKN